MKVSDDLCCHLLKVLLYLFVATLSCHEHQLWCCKWLEQIQGTVFSCNLYHSLHQFYQAPLLSKEQIPYFTTVYNCKNYQLLLDCKLVQDLLLQLDPYKSRGPDGINPRILKELPDVITKPLLKTSELSRESGEVSAHWKVFAVTFKKGKKDDRENYRPDSVTLVPGKITENIVVGNTENYLEDNIAISHSQHGFMRGKSYLSNLIPFYNRVAHLVDQGKPVDVIFLDFSKAFETVSHSIFQQSF